MSDKASPVRVGITLSGASYRHLIHEMESHVATLKSEFVAIEGGPAKRTAGERYHRMCELLDTLRA